MDFQGLFQHNNTVENLKDDYDYFPTFNIEDRWLAVWNVYGKGVTDRNIGWSFTFHKARENISNIL